MKKKLLLGITMIATFAASQMQAQERYLDEIFTDSEINVVKDVTYGVNVDFLLSDFSNVADVTNDLIALKTMQATSVPFPPNWFIPNPFLPPADTTNLKLAALKMDVYMPKLSVDTTTERPVILVLHTGSFLPTPKNGQATGIKEDSSLVANCRMWAKKGFVAIAMNYRGGWNPVAPTVQERRGTLLNAVYRAIHDTKQAVRVIKQTTVQGNPWGVNKDKVVLYGQGTGGYITLAYVTLDKPGEIALPKFLNPLTGLSYIDTVSVGNYDGYDTPLQPSISLYLDTFNFSNEVQMSVNSGGALADISWLEAGDPAMVSVMCVRDPFAPFDSGTVVVPTSQEDVVDVNGPNSFIPKANQLGNNGAFYNVAFIGDEYTTRARELYGTTMDYIFPAPFDKITIDANADGLFPIVKPLGGSTFENIGSPWDWWSFSDLQASVAAWNGATGDVLDATVINGTNPDDNDPAHGLAYVDTIQGYVNPRIMRVLQVGNWEALSVNEVERVNEIYTMYPNPASDVLEITSKEGAIQTVEVYDITGKLMSQKTFGATQVTLSVDQLSSGVYFVNVVTGRGSFMEKLIIE